jgi:iron-sulfur cluster assembly accessory protein
MSQTIESGISLTEQAQGKVRTLIAAEGRDDLRLRVAVQPGGCSGLIYQLYFDEQMADGDVVTDFDGVEVIIDKMSVPYLDGASIDFEDTIQKQGFTIDNPNAAGSCAAETRSTKHFLTEIPETARAVSGISSLTPIHILKMPESR